MDDKGKLLPWDDLGKLTEELTKQIPEETLEFAVDKVNHDQMFESALESLKQSNPEATFEEAEKLVEQMREFAKMALEARK